MLRFTTLTLAAWLFFVTSGQAAAAPIAGIIVGLIGLGGTAVGGILTTVIGVGLTVGASIGLSALLSPEQQAVSASQANSGVRADVVFGGKVHHELAFARVAIGGHYVYVNTSGSNNQRLDQVYVLSTGWCEALEELKVNSEDCDLTEVDSGTGWTKYAVTLPDDGGTRRLWVTFWDGRPDQAVNQTLVDSANPSGRWTSSHIGAGICYAHIEADYVANVESFRSILGGNAFLFVFKGLRLYDVRKDSTAGGSGAHRFDDPATWEWSANPAVCKYHYERGYFINGELAGGMGVASYDLLTDLYMAAANVCDEDVPLDGGGTEKRYELSLIASTGAEHIDAIDSMVSAMAGMRVERQGLFGVVAGAAQLPVATVTDGDLIADAPVFFVAKRPREDLFNEIYGQYTDPENLWDGSDIVPIVGDSGVKALDGGETRHANKDLYQITSGTRGQRLLRIAYRLNRHQRSAQITLGEEAIAYEVGDWITWNSARYGNVTYLISGHVHDVENDVVNLSLEEVSNQIFSWGTGDESPLVLPPTPPATGPRPSNVNGLTLQAATISGADGQKLPAIAVSWSAVEDETIRSVILEYKIKGEADETAQRKEVTRPASGDWTGTVLASGILAGTDYEVRSSITTFPPRAVTWSGWAEIETSGEYVVPSAGSIYDEVAGTIPAAELLGDLEAVDELARQLRDSLSQAGAPVPQQINDVAWQLNQAAEGMLRNLLDTQDLQTTLKDAGIEVVNNKVRIFGLDQYVSDNDARVSEVEISLDAANSQIALKASLSEVENLIATTVSYTPARRWEWNGTVESWTGVNASLAAGTSTVTVTGTGANSGLSISGLSIDASEATFIRFRVKRNSGSNWSGLIEWDTGSGFNHSQAITAPNDASIFSDVTISLANDADWTGTVQGLRLTLGDGSSVYELDYLEVSANALYDLLTAGIEAQISEVQADLDAVEGELSLRATVADLSAAEGRITSAEQRLDGAEAAIALTATQASLDAVEGRVDTAEVEIDALQGQIQQQVVSISVDNNSQNELNARTLMQRMFGDLDYRNNFEGRFASAVSSLIARTDAGDEALAQQVTSLTAIVDQNAADILSEQTVRADADSALAQSLTSVSSTVDGHTSSISVLQSSVDGIHAQYVLSVQAGGVTGGFVVRGIERADGTGEIAFGIRSNLFYIVDTDDFDQAEAPFIYANGKLYVREAVIPNLSADKITAGELSAISADLGTVTAGKLQSADGNMVIDLNAKRILIQ